MKSDEGFWFGRGDGDDLADVTGSSPRTRGDDGTGLARPAAQIGAELSHNSQGGIVSDVEGVGKSVSRSRDRCRARSKLGSSGIKGIFDSFFHSVGVCICVERGGCGVTQSR